MLCEVPEILHPELKVISLTVRSDEDATKKMIRKTWVKLTLAHNSDISVSFIFWANGMCEVEFGGRDVERDERHCALLDDLVDEHITSMLMHSLFFAKTHRELDMGCSALNAAARQYVLREPPIGPRPPPLDPAAGEGDEDSD